MYLCLFIKSLLPFFTSAEALKSYPYQVRTGKAQMQEIEQLANAAGGHPPDRNSLNKLMALRNAGINIPMNSESGQDLFGSPQAAAFGLTNYQTMLMKQNHPKAEQPTNATIHQETQAIKELVFCCLVLFKAHHSAVFLPVCLLSVKCQAPVILTYRSNTTNNLLVVAVSLHWKNR
ncbi:hypothetical protein Bca4012_005789 [Brassica carinata]